MAKVKKDEKHITVSTATYDKLIAICKRKSRNYKAQVTLLIEDEFNKTFKGEKDGKQ